MATSFHPPYIEAILRTSMNEEQRRALRQVFEYLAERLGSDLATLDEEKAEAEHTHDAADVVSGTLDADRIPNLDASKITTGTIDNARLDGNITHDDVAETISAAWTFNAAITAPNTPRCSVYNSTSQSIGTGSSTALTFDSETFDVGAMHDTGSNPSRITIPSGQGGVYLFVSVVTVAGNATGQRIAFHAVNGNIATTDPRYGHVRIPAASTPNPQGMQIMSIMTLAAGDYVETYLFQDSGGNLNSGSATVSNQNHFMAVRLW